MLFVLAVTLFSTSVIADPVTWLGKINKAASEISFSGRFVYIVDGKVQAMEMVRRISDGIVEERLYSLNGSSREVIRSTNKVRCYLPDKKLVVHDRRHDFNSVFPRIAPRDLSQLTQNYNFHEGDERKIANRMAIQIKIEPNDHYRYGYELWADKSTGLLLRSDLIDMEGNIIEQYLFVDIEIRKDIDESELQPSNTDQDLQVVGNMAQDYMPLESMDWEFSNMPKGFKLSGYIHRKSVENADKYEHMVFSDGLSSISVFARKTQEGQRDMSGSSNMGAMNAYQRLLGNSLFTVMGEVPAVTVEELAMGIKSQTS